MPTLLEVAETQHPGAGTYQGREIVAMQGRPMQPLLKGDQESIRKPDDYMGWELFDRRAIRQGDWKIVYLSNPPKKPNKIPGAKMREWQLYNLAEDPSEVKDVSAEHPKKLADMLALWDDYVKENGVLLRE